MNSRKTGFAVIEILLGGTLVAIAFGLVALASHLVPIQPTTKELNSSQTASEKNRQTSQTPTPVAATPLAQKPDQRQKPKSVDNSKSEPRTKEVANRPRVKNGDRKGPKTSSHENLVLDYPTPGNPTSCQIDPSLHGCAAYYYDPLADPYSPESQQQYAGWWWYAQQDPAQLFFNDPAQLYMQNPLEYGMLEQITGISPIPGLPSFLGQ